MEALSNKLSLFYLFLLFTMVFTMRRERNWKDVEDVVIYTKEIKEKKENKRNTYLPLLPCLPLLRCNDLPCLGRRSSMAYRIVHLRDLHYEKKRQTKEKACSSP